MSHKTGIDSPEISQTNKIIKFSLTALDETTIHSESEK
jgi:hypothetical protein